MITVNGNTTAVAWEGGWGDFVVWGTFDSATIKLQYSQDNSTWMDIGTAASFTSDGGTAFLKGKCWLRINTSGGGGSLSVDSAINQITENV